MTKRGKAWIVVGVAVLALSAVVFWGVNREQERADAQEAVMVQSCIRNVNLKMYGLTSSSSVEVQEVTYDQGATKVSGTFRVPFTTGTPLYKFECHGYASEVEYERVQGN